MIETGRGRLLLDPAKWHDDLRLLEVARKRRWDTDETFRDVIISRLKNVIEMGDDGIALKAIAEARHMEAQNQRDEHKAIDEFSNRVIELAARLGIDVGALGVGEASGIGAIGSDAEPLEAEEE